VNRFAPPFLLLTLCFAVLGMAVFVPGLPGGFVLDDGANILQNRILYVDRFDVEQFVYAALSFHDGTGSRALPMLTFALDYWRAGAMDVEAFKLTNIGVHGLTALALAFFLRRLFRLAQWSEQRAVWGALLVALAWAIHPLQVSSVLYVVQRMQTMSSFFIILALWAYVAMREAQLAGGRGRLQGGLLVLVWLLALACKEDAVLLPVYTLALELTLLRFAAGQRVVARGLRQSYGLMLVLGGLLFVFYALPHYWHWDAYPGRNFSSSERLLTQGRVLVMYLGQILLPWPDWMPFYYDNYQVSRSLWQPWTTLPSLAILFAMLFWAWRWRHRQPLFAFGIFFFFAGHFLASNVIGLELVFEHRNHLPLLGMLLALADLLLLVVNRLQLNRPSLLAALTLCLVFVSAATLMRAYMWGDPLRFAEKSASLAPQSNRSWIGWSNFWFSRYKQTKDTQYLYYAVDVAERSFEHTASVAVAGNILLFKSILGNLEQSDWQRFYEILRGSPPGGERGQAMEMFMTHPEKNFVHERAEVVKAMQLMLVVEPPGFTQAMRMGVYAYKAGMPLEAMVFFRRAALVSSPDEPTLKRLMGDLVQQGHPEMAAELQALLDKRGSI